MNKQTGWTNQTTRNIQLYIDNDEQTKRFKVDLIKLIHRPINEQDVRYFVRDYLESMHRTLLTSSSDSGYNIEDINWQEIANAWEEERHHMKRM
ncbi:MAG: hypothetical protein PVH54_04935 [Gammaproteobacteria bacterium]